MSPVLPTLVIPVMTGAPYHFPITPTLPVSTGAHASLSLIPKNWSHDFWAGRTTSNYRFSSSASSDEERLPDGAHVASAKRRRSTFPLPITTGAPHSLKTPHPVHTFLLPITTAAHSLDTPLPYIRSNYQSRRTHLSLFPHP